MRIGIVYWDAGSSNMGYRAIAPGHALTERGYDVAILPQTSDQYFKPDALFGRDVVHIYHEGHPALRQTVEALQQRGTAVTWDMDDDIRLIPDHHRRKLGMSEMGVQRDFQLQAKMLRRVDLATTTTAYLALRFRAAGAEHVTVIPNHLNRLQYASHLSAHGQVVIGWVAASEHQADVDPLGVSDTLRRVIERRPAVRVVTVGVRLDLPEDRYEYHRWVPFVELKELIRHFDIGIAPIADAPMNHARSDIKIKEYAAAGVPWVASARGPYADYGAEQGGVVVGDDGWDAALSELVTRRFLRYRLRRRAIAWAKTQAIERHVDLWVRAFEQAIEIRVRRAGSGDGPRAAAVGRRAM